jgi:hypothetical protein
VGALRALAAMEKWVCCATPALLALFLWRRPFRIDLGQCLRSVEGQVFLVDMVHCVRTCTQS